MHHIEGFDILSPRKLFENIMGVDIIFTLLIVDDEINICKLINLLVDWDALNIECIGFSQNGEDAYARIVDEKPDIVITDIRMPGYSGLELIKKCKEEGISSQFIILSGYAQFDYAHSAIRYGVNDFLLKPINRVELNEALERTVSNLGLPVESNYTSDASNNLRRSLFYALMHNEYNYTLPDIDQLNRDHGFAFKQGLFQVVIITLDCDDPSNSQVFSIIKKLKKDMISEFSSACFDYFLMDKDTRIYCILNYDKKKSADIKIAFQYAFSSMQNTIAPYGCFQLTMGHSAAINTPNDLQMAYSQAFFACESRIVLGTNSILDGSQLNLELTTADAITVEEPNKAICSALELMDIEICKSTIRQEFLRQLPDTKKHPYCVHIFAGKFVRLLLNDINNLYPMQETLQDLSHSIVKKVLCCSTIESIIESIIENVSSLLDELSSNSSDKKIISIVKSYIDEHYHEHIDLEVLADRVYLSVSYLGILFKKETGVNFSDYLTTVRIEKAMEKLKDVKYKVSDVALAVGYRDVKYFSKVFKKVVGLRPAEYKKLTLSSLDK